MNKDLIKLITLNAKRYVPTYQDAEDVCQQCLMLFNKKPELMKTKAILFVAIRNVAKTYYRDNYTIQDDKKRQRILLLDFANFGCPVQKNPENIAMKKDDVRLLNKNLNNLTAMERNIIQYLYLTDGGNYISTAKELNMNLGTVRTVGGNGIRKLRNLLDKSNFSDILSEELEIYELPKASQETY